MRVKLGKIADSDYDGCTACCNLSETATIAAAIAVTFQKKRKVTNSKYIKKQGYFSIKSYSTPTNQEKHSKLNLSLSTFEFHLFKNTIINQRKFPLLQVKSRQYISEKIT